MIQSLDGGCLEKVQVYASTIFSVLAQKIAGAIIKQYITIASV